VGRGGMDVISPILRYLKHWFVAIYVEVVHLKLFLTIYKHTVFFYTFFLIFVFLPSLLFPQCPLSSCVRLHAANSVDRTLSGLT
jgi:hypothetical protein